MKRLAKWSSVALAVIALLAAVAWFNRVEIMLGAIETLAARRLQPGPHQPITWSTGADASGRSAAERPPNIVLILADDLGWNDLTIAGGGVAGGTVPTPQIDSIAHAGVNFSNG